MFYILTVAFAVAIITVVNFFVGGSMTVVSFGLELLLTLAGVAIVFVIDGLFAFIARRLPEKWFTPDAKHFDVRKGEQNFYRRLGIKKWKKFIPEWGCFTGFHKDKIREPESSEYIGRFLIESNYGVLGHVAGAIFGFAIIFIPFFRPLAMALPIAAVNLVLSLLPTMLLRFNTPPLRRMYRRNLEKENSATKKEAEQITK